MTSAKSFKAENTTHMSIQNMRRINQSLSTPMTTCPTQSDLSEKVSRRDTDWAYSKCPLSTKSTTSTTTTPCWRIDVEVDHYCGYFLFQGRRYYQRTLTAWVAYSGFLSIYPGGQGYNKELDEYRDFHGKCPSKFNKYFHFHVICNMCN